MRERGRDELDERFGIIRGDVLVRERRAERPRMRGLRNRPIARDPQRFLLDALAAALQNLRLAAVEQASQALLEAAIDDGVHCVVQSNGVTVQRHEDPH